MAVLPIGTNFDITSKKGSELGGTGKDLFIIDYDFWRTATITTEANGLITNIIFNTTGAKAVKYTLQQGGAKPSSESVINAGMQSGFTHTVEVHLPTKDQTIRDEITNYQMYRRAVLIVELQASIGYQAYGFDQGLMITASQEPITDPAIGGGMTFTFSTPENVSPERCMPAQFLNTDIATTKALLNDLLVAVP